MEPRLKNSKKWTPFPKEYSDQIRAVFDENFAKFAEGGKFVVEGRIYTEEVMLRVGYLEKGRLAQANCEVSVNYSAKEQDAVDRIHNCVDAAASMMLEYFENEGEVDFPKTWKAYPFAEQTIYLKFNTENSELEAQADALLGTSDEGMLVEEAEGSDALENADIDEDLSQTSGDEWRDPEDEDDEEATPKMFGGGKKKKSKKDDLH